MGHQMKAWIARWTARLRHSRSDADLKDELQAHLELYAEDNTGPGVPPQEARRRAHLAIGSTHAVIESVRDQELITILESCWQDFVLGIRALRKSPVFCLTAILTVGIGTGANTAIFTLLHALLLRSLPVEEPGQLARLGLVTVQRTTPMDVPYRLLQHLRSQQSSFSGISAWSINSATMEDRDGTLRNYQVGLVGGNGFDLLGMRAYAGRLIQASDDVRGGPPDGWPVVLSYGFWQDRFGADPRILGQTFKLSNTLVTIAGVAPREFQGVWPGYDPKLYLPMQFLNVLAGRDVLNAPNSFAFCADIGRLKPGISLDRAAAEIAARQAGLLREFLPPQWNNDPDVRTARLKLESARTGLPTFFGSTYSGPLYLMQGLVAVVLLLCCVNVSGLMMSKIHERQREFAIRTAIGAARWRLIRQYLTESFVIASAGAALGAALAWYGSGLMLPFFRHPNWHEGMFLKPDDTVFLATAVFAVLTTLFFGILPALKAGRSDPGLLLKSRTAAGRRQIAGRAFVPIQVSLSVVLVALAALLSQSMVRLRGESTGFDVDHVTIQTPPFHRLGLESAARVDLYQRMVDRIERAANIRSAAVTWITPMTGVQPSAAFEALADGSGAPEIAKVTYNDVGPGYFRTMRTNIVAGREFAKHERRRDVCVLNQAAASSLFPRQQAVGRYIRSADPKEFPEAVTCLVIGVAEDAKFASLREPPPRTVYFPITPRAIERAGNLVFLMNSAEKAQAIAAYREALQEIAPSIPLVLFVTLREQMDAALGSQRAITTLSSFFGGLALFLSAIGLYGLLSSSVAQRTAEIGVRIAMGAQRGAVLRMILSDALRLVGAGMVMGAFGLCLAVQSVKGMLYGVSASDVPTLVATGTVLAFVGLVAALAPAMRAASVDPIRALRAE